MSYYIIVYKNTHDAMEADKRFNEMKVECKIMPTPTTITQSCGFCTRLHDKINIDELIKESNIEFKNIYKKQEDGYVAIR